MTQLTRRQFAQCFVLGGVGLAFYGCGPAASCRPLTPQLWLELHSDGRIVMLTKIIEMGQGAHTGLRTLVAEELDVQPDAIEILQVPSDPKYGQIITGGSYTMAAWHSPMRNVAATARHMLLQAAAREWGVPVPGLKAENGFVELAGGKRREPYRRFVERAAELPVPEAVPLKAPDSWRYIGKPSRLAHLDTIVAGTACFGIDFRLEGMCFAVLSRAPSVGARLVSFDDTAAQKVPGFLRAVALPGNAWPSSDHCRASVAVVATNSWAAQQARQVLQVRWDESQAVKLDSQAIFETLEDHCSRPGLMLLDRGRVSLDLKDRRFEAHYRQPYLAHAPMEPPNAVARVERHRIEVWSGTQRQTRLKDAIVRELGAQPDDVIVHAQLIGGSFGRRLEVDYGLEAARLASELQRPVQVLWTREDDIRFGLYRSGSVHRLAATVDRSGKLTSFTHRVAAESVTRQQEADKRNNTEDAAIAAALIAFAYEVPRIELDYHAVAPMVPCAWWRGTYWTSMTAATECFIDELAELCSQDPLAFRLAHLSSDEKRELASGEHTRVPFDPERRRAVLRAAADHAGWSRAVPSGRARGIACGMYDSPECHVAVIVEAKLEGQMPSLMSAIVAVDVGTAVNPKVVEAQAMGGFVMGASVALREQITWQDGKVVQRGFEDYEVLRMIDCPDIKVIIVPSDAGFCGIGELVTPAAIAAVTNAVSRVTGRRTRSWPILPARV